MHKSNTSPGKDVVYLIREGTARKAERGTLLRVRKGKSPGMPLGKVGTGEGALRCLVWGGGMFHSITKTHPGGIN